MILSLTPVMMAIIKSQKKGVGEDVENLELLHNGNTKRCCQCGKQDGGSSKN